MATGFCAEPMGAEDAAPGDEPTRCAGPEDDAGDLGADDEGADEDAGSDDAEDLGADDDGADPDGPEVLGAGDGGADLSVAPAAPNFPAMIFSEAVSESR